MPETAKTNQASQTRLPNPLLDLTIAGLEMQLKAWQAYQVEGAHFIAKRLRANLELMRGLGHCAEAGHAGECLRAWLRDLQGDYGEECGRVAATTFSICFADLASMGLLFGPRAAKLWPNPQPGPRGGEPKLHVVA
jgi:hypothetical protein